MASQVQQSYLGNYEGAGTVQLNRSEGKGERLESRSANRVVIVSTPLFEEVGRLLGGAYYVGVKDASVYVSLNKELLKMELA